MNSLKNLIKNGDNVLDIVKKDNIPIVLFGKDDVGNVVYNLLKKDNINIIAQCDKDDFDLKTNKFSLVNVMVINRTPKDSEVYLKQKKNVKRIVFYDRLGENYYNLDYQNFVKNFDNYKKVYDYLEDKYSKQVFISFINTKITSDYTYTMNTETWGQYIENSVMDFNGIKSIIDCGCYHGEDIFKFNRELDKINSRYDKIYAFEADRSNFEIISKVLKEKKIKNVELFNMATWNEETILKFNESEKDSWSAVDEKGNVEVKADTLDNVLGEKKCDFIKMDIEGAEYNTLLGAKNIILKNRPKLAISVYHIEEDMFRIPFLIKSLDSSYKFYLRNYSKFGLDCVLYAI